MRASGKAVLGGLLLSSVILFTTSCAARKKEAGDSVGTGSPAIQVAGVRGTVQFKEAESTDWQDAQIGQTVQPGAKIRTQKASSAHLVHEQTGSVFNLDSETEIEWKELLGEPSAPVPSTTINVIHGSISGSFQTTDAEHEFIVSTPRESPRAVRLPAGDIHHFYASASLEQFINDAFLSINPTAFHVGQGALFFDPAVGNASYRAPDLDVIPEANPWVLWAIGGLILSARWAVRECMPRSPL